MLRSNTSRQLLVSPSSRRTFRPGPHGLSHSSQRRARNAASRSGVAPAQQLRAREAEIVALQFAEQLGGDRLRGGQQRHGIDGEMVVRLRRPAATASASVPGAATVTAIRRHDRKSRRRNARWLLYLDAGRAWSRRAALITWFTDVFCRAADRAGHRALVARDARRGHGAHYDPPPLEREARHSATSTIRSLAAAGSSPGPCWRLRLGDRAGPGGRRHIVGEPARSSPS